MNASLSTICLTACIAKGMLDVTKRSAAEFETDGLFCLSPNPVPNNVMSHFSPSSVEAVDVSVHICTSETLKDSQTYDQGRAIDTRSISVDCLDHVIRCRREKQNNQETDECRYQHQLSK